MITKIYSKLILFLLITAVFTTSCEQFFNPDQEISITDENLFDDWYEYRAVTMGLYKIQSELIEQIVILGELRADLLQVTDFADADLLEIYNFNISKENKYASPVKFFNLISACNNLIRTIERNHPEVLTQGTINNYDRVYGEVLCMRAWAYFNAVRIYGTVPFIHQSLTTIEEVEAYLNSTGQYIDSVEIVYARNGFGNDTSYNSVIILDKQYFDQKLVIDYFTNELETKVKAVGVNHSINNNDDTWEVTVWNEYAKNTLLGLMYLTDGDLLKARDSFEKVVYNNTEDYRYQLDVTFSNTRWKDIFTNVDIREHILIADFNKGSFQQNDFQKLFDPRQPHEYMLKPTKKAVLYWEAIWDNFTISGLATQPDEAELGAQGKPGDFFRGYNVSYAYYKNGVVIPTEDIRTMLNYRAQEDFQNANLITAGADTVVWKYSWNKGTYDRDADFSYFRASSVHLWLAEIYTYLAVVENGILRESTPKAEGFLNNGSNYTLASDRVQLGVRGRVGFGGSFDGSWIGNIIFIHDPYTNEILDFRVLTNDFLQKQEVLEQYVIDERARELAFEGERFYDLIRVARRRNDPTFLANAVAEKFPAGKREEIYNLLIDENNWTINAFN